MQTDKQIRIQKRTTEYSENVKLENFEKEDQTITKNNDSTFTAKILFRYSKNSIQKERARLKSLTKETHVDHNIIGEMSKELGGVEITSHPTGADIYIDGKQYAVTPSKINNCLQPGIHSIKISHPEYETVEVNVDIIKNKVSKVSQQLTKATTELVIMPNINDAKVYLNDKFIGITPISNYTVNVSKNNKIKIVRDNYFPLTIEDISFFKDTIAYLNPVLLRKSIPATISSNVIGANVFINDTYVGQTPVEAILYFGKNKIILQYPEHEELSDFVKVTTDSAVNANFNLIRKKSEEIRLQNISKN